MNQPQSLDDLFSSKYLKAADLKGREATVTIREYKMVSMKEGEPQKLVLYFEGKDKGLVINKTNAGRIAKVLDTRNFGDWLGKKIVLYPDMVDFQGDTVEAIRVRGPIAPEGEGSF